MGKLYRAMNINSQNGEDGILSFIFGKDGPLFEEEDSKTIVEVGAWDGKYLSNSHYLISGEAQSKTGCGFWKGVLIEGDIEKSSQAKITHRERLDRVTLITAMVGLKEESKLCSLLGKFAPSLSTSFEILSIDVDGIDYFIWKDFLEEGKYKPKIVVIEFNPTIPNHVIYIQDCNESIRQGCSLAAFVELASKHGYSIIETTLYNAIFVLDELLPKFFGFIPNPIHCLDVIHELQMGTDLFQLYDGTLQIAGCKKMLWHRISMDINKMQVIKTKKDQSFPFAPKHEAMQSFELMEKE